MKARVRSRLPSPQIFATVRQIAIGLQKAPEQIPARWISIRFAAGKLHHAMLGMEPKTLSNHRSNAKAALAWFTGAANVPRRGALFSVDWEALRRMLGDSPERKRLLALMRFCSSQGISPGVGRPFILLAQLGN